jgi:hypothetical protein
MRCPPTPPPNAAPEAAAGSDARAAAGSNPEAQARARVHDRPEAQGEPDPQAVIRHTRAWVRRVVVGLNLCPFAKAPLVKGQIGYVVTPARDRRSLRAALCAQLDALARADPSVLDTVLLIHPWVLRDFDAYNDFLDVADATLGALGYEGVLQIASFHPQYRFAGSPARALSNATNRSPYPLLHLLREASVDRAVAACPDPQDIVAANQATLQRLGPAGWERLQRQCRHDAAAD